MLQCHSTCMQSSLQMKKKRSEAGVEAGFKADAPTF